MPFWRHIISGFILGGITANLLFWTVPVVTTVAFASLVRTPSVRRWSNGMIEAIYHAAVQVDSLLVTRVLGIDIKVHGPPPADRGAPLIVLSNHQSWFDILVVHHIISRDGPILKFLIKRELVWVPIVGWLCLALDFPRLVRGKADGGREKDLQSVAAAAASVDESPWALMNFAEGTRFSRAKHEARGSEYRHLLNPRAGGLGIMLGGMPAAAILDLTIVYPVQDVNFWRCLGGQVRSVDVYARTFSGRDIGDVSAWLADRWQEKDALIDARMSPQKDS